MDSEREHGAFETRLTSLEAWAKRVEDKVDKLLEFRSWVLGGVSVVSLVVSAFVAWFVKKAS